MTAKFGIVSAGMEHLTYIYVTRWCSDLEKPPGTLPLPPCTLLILSSWLSLGQCPTMWCENLLHEALLSKDRPQWSSGRTHSTSRWCCTVGIHYQGQDPAHARTTSCHIVLSAISPKHMLRTTSVQTCMGCWSEMFHTTIVVKSRLPSLFSTHSLPTSAKPQPTPSSSSNTAPAGATLSPFANVVSSS